MARAKTPKPSKSIGGPFLASAVFCDSVVRGEDGAMTAVRMIDHITIAIPSDAPLDVPSEDKRILAQIDGLIGFKKGDSGARHQLKLVMNSPSGKSQVITEQVADFKDETHGGYNLRMKTSIAVSAGGLFWLDVYLDGNLVTRMPLLITIKRDDPEAKPAKSRKKKS